MLLDVKRSNILVFWKIDHWLDELKSILGEVIFSHVLRTANLVADSLAKVDIWGIIICLFLAYYI